MNFTLIFSQNSYNFQTIISNGNGETQKNLDLRFRVSYVYDNPDSNEIVFVEEHNTTSNEFGLINIIIGEGDILQGELSQIDYARTIFIKEEYDIGNGYTIKGYSKIMDVPVSSYTRNVNEKAFQRGGNFGVGSSSFNSNNEGDFYEDYNSDYNITELTYNPTQEPPTNSSENKINKKKNISTKGIKRSLNTDVVNSLNTGLGQGVFGEITTGSRNTSIGAFSQKNITSGAGNSSLGINTLKNLTSGFGNIALGSGALYNVEASSFSIAIGNSSLARFIGPESEYSILGTKNIAIGEGSQAFNLNQINNISIGTFSMVSVDTSNNIAIGDASLQNNQDSLYEGYSGNNIGIGKFSMGNPVNSTGSYNIALGNNSIANNQTLYSIAIGHNALANSVYNTSTSKESVSNIAIGYSSLNYNSGSRNISIGEYAMSNGLGDGSGNIAIGNKALFENTFGAVNIAIGGYTLSKNSNGTGNIGIGNEVLRNNTDGNSNYGIGDIALGENIDGSYNTAFGTNSLLENISGNYNTSIGFSSGRGTNGNNNTFIGAKTSTPSDLEQNISNSTAIGYRAIIYQSNSIQLGNEEIELVRTSGTVSATAFRGDGSQLTNLPQNDGFITQEGTELTIGDDEITYVNTSGVVSASGLIGNGNEITISSDAGDTPLNFLSNQRDWLSFLHSHFIITSWNGTSTSTIDLASMLDNEKYYGERPLEYVFRGITSHPIGKYLTKDITINSLISIQINSTGNQRKISFVPYQTRAPSSSNSIDINVDNFLSRFGRDNNLINLYIIDDENNAYVVDVENYTFTVPQNSNIYNRNRHFFLLPQTKNKFRFLIFDNSLDVIQNGKFIAPTDKLKIVTENGESFFVSPKNYENLNIISSSDSKIQTSDGKKGYVLSPWIKLRQGYNGISIERDGKTIYYQQ